MQCACARVTVFHGEKKLSHVHLWATVKLIGSRLNNVNTKPVDRNLPSCSIKISDFLLHQVKSYSHFKSLSTFANTWSNPLTAVSLELALTIINNVEPVIFISVTVYYNRHNNNIYTQTYNKSVRWWH